MLVRGLVCSTLLLGCAFTATAVTSELPAIPDKPEAEMFKDAPEPWRDYLIKARAAERIADPLQRCMAYPDIPGNRWPAGHAAAHCRHHAVKVLGLDEIDGYLQRGALDALERHFGVTLARHFSTDAFGEDIHNAFELFEDADDKTDRISALWLQKAPRSAYANLARANFYRDAAHNARGKNWASDTPAENFRRMTGFVEQAVPLFEKAIDIEPRLMPAYVGLLDVGKLDSRPELKAAAIRQASTHDPACLDMARYRMIALQPRWGGSYEQMLALASEISAQVARRPQLAMHAAAPYGDRGDRLVAMGEYTREAAEVLGIAVAIGSNENHLDDAASVAINARESGVRDEWKALVYLLQEARFGQRSAWTHRNIGRLLIRLEPEWSLHQLLLVDQEDAQMPYLLGAANYYSNRYAEAEKHYLAAIKDPVWRPDALSDLVEMLFVSGRDRALIKPLADQFVEEQPGNPMAWFAHAMSFGRVTPESVAAFGKFVELADRNDPWQANKADEIAAALKQWPANPKP